MSLNTAAILLVAAQFAVLLVWRGLAARRQRRVLGWDRYHECATATKMVARFSGRLAYLYLGACIWLAVGVYLLEHQRTNVLLTVAALCLVIWGLAQVTQQGVPASILVLGASGEEQISLQAAIRDAVFPFRPVSFLQTGILRVDMKIPGDCFRIDRVITWSDAVHAFCRAVPIIVLDIRSTTPLVREEIEHIFAAGHAYKTLFIDEDGRATLERDVCRVPDTQKAISLLQHLFLEREILPTPEAPLSSLGLEWRNWQLGQTGAAQEADWRQPERNAFAGAWASTQVRGGQLAPFTYQTPPDWHLRVLVDNGARYAVLLRPPEESAAGISGWLRRRSRLDLMVFPYTAETVSDEAAFRRATTLNLSRRGASITWERLGRRGAVLKHECFFQLGRSQGYLMRFITNRNEYVVQWNSTDGPAMQRHLPTVQEFIDRLQT